MRRWSTLVVLATTLVLLLGACSGDGSDGAASPTGLGPELDQLLERCATKGDGERPCFLAVSDLSTDGGRDLETVPGTRAAARDVCRALIPIEPTRLAGLTPVSVAEDSEGPMLSCASPTGVMINVIRGGRKVTDPCRADDVDAPCQRQDDGSKVWDRGDRGQPLLARQWDNGDAVVAIVGANAGGADDEKQDLADTLIRETAAAFDLGS